MLEVRLGHTVSWRGKSWVQSMLDNLQEVQMFSDVSALSPVKVVRTRQDGQAGLLTLD